MDTIARMTRTEAHQCCGSETPVFALPDAERFVVWAIRVWIDAHCRGQIPCPRLQDMFTHMRLQDCIGPFYALLSLIAGEAARELDFRCPGCRKLGADERAALTLFAAIQQGATPVAAIILEDWLPPAVAERAAYPARLVANGLADSGLLLQRLGAPRPLAIAGAQRAAH